MRIIASLTTIPSRINLIQPTIESIVKQTISIESVEINIPYNCRRTGDEYVIPEWLLALEQSSKGTQCEIRIFRTEDYGAITKIAPTLIRHRNEKDTYIWCLDDDFAYPENMLAVLYREFIPTRNYILCHSKALWDYDDDKNCKGYASSRREGFGDFLEGFSSVLYPAFVIGDDFEDYLARALHTDDNRNSDDVIISNYFNLKDIKIYCCAYPYSLDRILLGNKGAEYGQFDDALHNQGGGNTARYIRVYNWLRDHNLNSWIQKQS
jgi:hypothetical protein